MDDNNTNLDKEANYILINIDIDVDTNKYRRI